MKNKILKIIFILPLLLISLDSSGAGPMRMGDRWQIYNKLYAIFSGADDANTRLEQILLDEILGFAYLFGGSCDLHEPTIEKTRIDSAGFRARFIFTDERLRCFRSQDFDTPAVQPSSSARQGLMMQACYKIINDGDLLANAKDKFCSDCTFNENNIQSAYQLFYPYITLTSNNLTYFYDLLKAQGPDDDDPLKDFLLALCYDPNWQAF